MTPMQFIESMIRQVTKSVNLYAQCLTNFNKIKLCNQCKNVQIGIVQKSFQPHNDKPKVSSIENIDKKMTTIQIVIEM